MKSALPSRKICANFTQRRTNSTQAAFSLPELLIITTVIIIIIGVAVPSISKSKAKRQRMICTLNLTYIGLDREIFTNANALLFLSRTNLNNSRNLSSDDQILRLVQTLSNDFNPKILVCPADIRKPANTWAGITTNNLSYFLSVDVNQSYPQSFLAGDRNLTLDGQRVSGRVHFTTNDLVAWDQTIHNSQGNALMADGSVQQLSSARLRFAAQTTGLPTNTFLIP